MLNPVSCWQVWESDEKMRKFVDTLIKWRKDILHDVILFLRFLELKILNFNKTLMLNPVSCRWVWESDEKMREFVNTFDEMAEWHFARCHTILKVFRVKNIKFQ